MLILMLGGCGASAELPIVGTWNAVSLTEPTNSGPSTYDLPRVEEAEGGTDTSSLHLNIYEDLAAELLWVRVSERSGGAARWVDRLAMPGSASEAGSREYLVSLDVSGDLLELSCTQPDSRKRLDCTQVSTDFGAVFERE